MELDKTCSCCPRPLDKKGARGLCHACYENWRYHQAPQKLQAINARSYKNNRAARLRTIAAWRSKHKEAIRESGRAYRIANKERLIIYYENWKANNKHKMRNTHLRRKFGIGLEEYEKILETQKGCCAICSKTQRSKNKLNLCVDHDHRTQRIRGLLCSNCNQAIGLLGDSATTLKTAVNYLSIVDRD